MYYRLHERTLELSSFALGQWSQDNPRVNSISSSRRQAKDDNTMRTRPYYQWCNIVTSTMLAPPTVFVASSLALHPLILRLSFFFNVCFSPITFLSKGLFLLDHSSSLTPYSLQSLFLPLLLLTPLFNAPIPISTTTTPPSRYYQFNPHQYSQCIGPGEFNPSTPN